MTPRHGACICDLNPGTTSGPEEFCPEHGRPYHELVEIIEQQGAELARLRSPMSGSAMQFVQAECRILYGMDADGKQLISTTYVADGVDGSVPDYFTGLLMFEVAKVNFLQRHGIIPSPDQEA